MGAGKYARMMRRRGGAPSPVPLTDLSFWYEFDNASKIIEDGTNIQQIESSGPFLFPAQPIVNDPLYSAANGRATFNFGSTMSLQTLRMRQSGYPVAQSLITSGFFAMVIELDSTTVGRWLSGVSSANSDTPGSDSGNVYGNFFGFNSGGFKLRYRGRLSNTGGTFLNIDGTTTLTTGQKYLLQIYVPQTGGTYYEIDGVAQNFDAIGDRFCGILDLSPAIAWKVDFGFVASTSPIYAGDHKVYEFISYQNYNATAYATVESYLKSKYGIT